MLLVKVVGSKGEGRNVFAERRLCTMCLLLSARQIDGKDVGGNLGVRTFKGDQLVHASLVTGH